MGHASLAAMFYDTCSRYPDSTGYMYKKNGKYTEITYREIESGVNDLAGGFAALGARKGERIILLAENRFEWAYCDYAAIACGAVTVPVYATLLAKQAAYIIKDSEARIVVISTPEQLAKIRDVKSELTGVAHFILMDDEGVEEDWIISLADLAAKGREFAAANPHFREKAIGSISRDDLATIIYTSGTTGEPKGVMLTHGNLLSNVEAACRALPFTRDDLLLSFLPLSHIFERMVGHFTPMYGGAKIAYAESIDKVPQNLLEVHPTVMASVPRLFEKIYGRVIESVEAGSPLKKKLFFWAMNVGREVIRYRQKGESPPAGLKIKFKLADRLVFSKLKERVGGRIRFFLSGGAPLSPEIGEFFTAAGLLVIEGYGLTETSPVITCNRIEKFRAGTVGLKLDNVEVQIAADGEILTRGPHVMKGYYNKPEATREVIDADGWFHTGDIGEFDADGMLRITDRKKNIIVTAGGKNIAPQKMENLLVMSRYVEQALVIGDKRKFCSAVIVPNYEILEKYAKDQGIRFQNHRELVTHPAINDVFQKEVDQVNADCASYETIKKFILIAKPFSIETGELTPSLKVKRKVVEKNYQGAIDALYQASPAKAG